MNVIHIEQDRSLRWGYAPDPVPNDDEVLIDVYACGVNRMTFYYHFKDIYDLVEWTCQDFAQKGLGGNRTASTWQQGLLGIFDAVRANASFVDNVYHSVSREQLERYLHDVTYDLLIGVVDESARGLPATAEQRAFIADFYKYGFVGLVLAWIRDGMREDPERIVERLSTMVRGNFRKALVAFSEADGADASTAGATARACDDVANSPTAPRPSPSRE